MVSPLINKKRKRSTQDDQGENIEMTTQSGKETNGLQGLNQTKPLDADTEKLLTILEMLNKDALERTVDHQHGSLKQALLASPSAPISVLRDLTRLAKRAAIDALPKLPPYNPPNFLARKKLTKEELQDDEQQQQERLYQHQENQRQLDDIDAWERQVLRLLDELEHGRAAPGGTGQPGILPVPKEEESQAVLHRVVAGAIDVFSSTNQNSLDEAFYEAMEEVKDTDLAAMSLHHNHMTRRPAEHSRLGQVSLPPRPPPTRYPASLSNISADSLSLTSTLYYDPFSSFAPSFDSTHAQLSYAETLQVLDSKERLSKHRSVPLLDMLNQEEDVTRKESAKLEEMLAVELGVSAEDVKAMADADARDKLSSILSSNAEKLKKLQLAQWERLRQEAGQAQKTSVTARPEEVDTASALLADMTDVMTSYPVSAHQLASRSFLRRILSSPALPDRPQDVPVNFVGTLGTVNDVAVSEFTMTKQAGYRPRPQPNTMHGAGLQPVGKKGRKRKAYDSDEDDTGDFVQPKSLAGTANVVSSYSTRHKGIA